MMKKLLRKLMEKLHRIAGARKVKKPLTDESPPSKGVDYHINW